MYRSRAEEKSAQLSVVLSAGALKMTGLNVFVVSLTVE